MKVDFDVLVMVVATCDPLNVINCIYIGHIGDGLSLRVAKADPMGKQLEQNCDPVPSWRPQGFKGTESCTAWNIYHA